METHNSATDRQLLHVVTLVRGRRTRDALHRRALQLRRAGRTRV